MQDSSRECHVCRKKSNKRDESVQVSPESFVSMAGMSSGIVEVKFPLLRYPLLRYYKFNMYLLTGYVFFLRII